MPAVEILGARRVVASAEALDRVSWPDRALVLRVAPDEVILIGPGDLVLDDPHALIEPDDGVAGVWISAVLAEDWVARAGGFELAETRPTLVQGRVAALPVRIWLERERALVMVPTAFAHELEARLV